MVGALDSGSSGPGSSPGGGTALCSWARNFTFIVPHLFIHLGGDVHYKSEVCCTRTQSRDPHKGSSLYYLGGMVAQW